MKRLVQVLTAKKSPQTANPELAYEKKGLILGIDGSAVIQDDKTSFHFLQNTLPELTNKALQLMGLNLSVLEVNIFVCGTGGSVKFTHSSTSGNNSFI